jgi:hypothetical protein
LVFAVGLDTAANIVADERIATQGTMIFVPSAGINPCFIVNGYGLFYNNVQYIKKRLKQIIVTIITATRRAFYYFYCHNK